MNTPLELSPDNSRVNETERLITDGLGYCCESFFWETYLTTPTELIAARLGVTERTVRRHKRAYREGLFACSGKSNCIIARWRIKCLAEKS